MRREDDEGSGTATDTLRGAPGQGDRPLAAPGNNQVIEGVHVCSRQRPDSPAACRLAQRSGAHGSGSADHVGHRQGRGPLPRLSSRLARDILSTVAQRPASHPVGPVRRARSSVAHAHGLELVYHHHLGTVIQTKEETIRLMELTDPAKVSLLFDTGHAYVGDGDVMGLLEATIDRVKHVHFKDVRPEKMEESKAAERSFLDSFLAGMFTVPGDGTIDFTVPYKFLVDHGYSEWILVEAEQDPAIANPLEYARKARAYLEGTLFKA